MTGLNDCCCLKENQDTVMDVIGLQELIRAANNLSGQSLNEF